MTNYSAEARKNGVIFYTRISIGYDAPWRKVHELLINGALSTEDLLQINKSGMSAEAGERTTLKAPAPRS